MNYVRWRAYWTPAGQYPGPSLHVWFFRGYGVALIRDGVLIFSDRYVWRKVRIGNWWIVFKGWKRKDAS